MSDYQLDRPRESRSVRGSRAGVLGRCDLQGEVQARKSSIVQRQQLISPVLDGRLGVHEVVNPGAAHSERAGFLEIRTDESQ